MAPLAYGKLCHKANLHETVKLANDSAYYYTKFWFGNRLNPQNTLIFLFIAPLTLKYP